MTLTRELGATGIEVTRLCAGAAAWSSPDHPHGGCDPAESAALADALFRGETVRYLDTSNNYGDGESERRIGSAIRGAGGIPPRFVVQTKADRDMATGDFSGSRMRASIAESLERLGLTHLPIVFLHDPENTTWQRAMADDGPVAALVAARDEGLVGHLGLSGGPVALLTRFLETGHFEAVITHNRYTLVDRTADPLLDLAAARGLGVLNAAPYGGGMLTGWPVERTRYAYGEAPPALISAANEMGRLCAQAGVPFAAAALQFSTRDPRITSTIVGMRTVGDLEASIELDAMKVPDELWAALNAVPLDPSTWQDAGPFVRERP
ncbi:MAG: aldo/keto reductase [Ornithinibacter sp.]